MFGFSYIDGTVAGGAKNTRTGRWNIFNVESGVCQQLAQHVRLGSSICRVQQLESGSIIFYDDTSMIRRQSGCGKKGRFKVARLPHQVLYLLCKA